MVASDLEIYQVRLCGLLIDNYLQVEKYVAYNKKQQESSWQRSDRHIPLQILVQILKKVVAVQSLHKRSVMGAIV